MSRGSEVSVFPDFKCVMRCGGLFPVSLLISLHIVETDTGAFMPFTKELQDRFLAERIRTRAFARAFL